MYKKYFKRVLDIIFAVTAVFCLSPLLIAVSLWLWVANRKAGAFFSQPRPGKNGKIFRIYKFKSMTDERDAMGNLLPDEQRLTAAGRFVRSTSIDELPQLFNIIRGDMSLIGPRPLLPEYLALYSPEQARRHEVRPGITGWAQCHGRNTVAWIDKFRYDVWYVDHCSLSTDLKVFWMSVRKVIERDGISSASSATTEPFTGNNL